MLEISQKKELAPLTTFRIGGPARYFTTATSLDELREALRWASEKSVKIIIWGGGSNVLVSDKGIDGLVVQIAGRGIKRQGRRMICAAGEPLSALCMLAANEGLSGLSWAAGIPGTVGGAVRGNAGAYGRSMADSVVEVTAFALEGGGEQKYDNGKCAFRYRDSIFSSHSDLVIWEAVFGLDEGDPGEIRQEMSTIIKKRRERIPEEPSAGSIFKNLIFERLEEDNAGLAREALGAGCIKGGKVPAAWLIDRIGLKGKRIGGAQVSELHANIIVNTGGASAADVMMLISYIKQQVRTKLGVQLQEEIRYAGF